jgi:hypothetical protein
MKFERDLNIRIDVPVLSCARFQRFPAKVIGNLVTRGQLSARAPDT